MKIDIIVVYVQRYEHGHEMNFVPPITGIHLAAITPPRHSVRVIHQQVAPVDADTDADLIALSFFSGFAAEAIRLARMFKRRGKTIVAGGPHASFRPAEVLQYCDAVVAGEAESVWAELLDDAENGRLRKLYHGRPAPVAGLPTPRYDLLPDSFFVKHVVQATRGCPFTCSFCTVPAINPGFRMRPVEEVIRDVEHNDFPHWWQRKIVWFWDDNLTANRKYVKDLLRAMIPLKRWWLTQASLDIARDGELLDLMRESGCIGVFFGIETFGKEALKDANKRQNKAEQYKAAIEVVHRRGICVMAGFIAGFDGDTPDSIVEMAQQLYDVGVDVPFLSVLTPYKGTPLYDKLEAEGRLLKDRGMEFYNGYNVAFVPRNMTPEELLAAHRKLWAMAFSFRGSFMRVLRSLFRLRPGAALMTMAMNGFYCLKNLRGNRPINWEVRQAVQSASARPANRKERDHGCPTPEYERGI